MSTEVVVRADRCVASAVCHQLAPGRFTFTDEGVSAWVDTGEDIDADVVLEIARRCPVQAIEVFVDGREVV